MLFIEDDFITVHVCVYHYVHINCYCYNSICTYVIVYTHYHHYYNNNYDKCILSTPRESEVRRSKSELFTLYVYTYRLGQIQVHT